MLKTFLTYTAIALAAMGLIVIGALVLPDSHPVAMGRVEKAL